MKLVKRTVRKYGEEYGPETIEKYDLKGHLTYRKTLNKEERFSYDESGRLVYSKEVFPSGVCEETYKEYDKRGNEVYDKCVRTSDHGTVLSTTEYRIEYDYTNNKSHLLTMRTDGYIKICEEHWCEYNERGQIIHHLDNEGNEFFYKYGEFGNLLLSKKLKDGKNIEDAIYEYDNFGRLISSDINGYKIKEYEYMFETEDASVEAKYIGSVKFIDELPKTDIEVGNMMMVSYNIASDEYNKKVGDLEKLLVEGMEDAESLEAYEAYKTLYKTLKDGTTPEKFSDYLKEIKYDMKNEGAIVNFIESIETLVVYVWDGNEWVYTSTQVPEYGKDGLEYKKPKYDVIM